MSRDGEEKEEEEEEEKRHQHQHQRCTELISKYYSLWAVWLSLELMGCATSDMARLLAIWQRNAQPKCQVHTYCRCRWVFGVYVMCVCTSALSAKFINEIYKLRFNRKNIISSQMRRYAYLYGHLTVTYSRRCSRISATRSHFSISTIRLIVIVLMLLHVSMVRLHTHSLLGRIFIFP